MWAAERVYPRKRSRALPISQSAWSPWRACCRGIQAIFAGAAEAIPVHAGSIDLITAAGSLNYADLDLFFLEAARVLRADGRLLVYDFEPGRSFRDSTALDDWFRAFIARYPWPPHEGRELNPEILSDLRLVFG